MMRHLAASLIFAASACAPAAMPVAMDYPTTPPPTGPAPDFATPVAEERTLANGLRVIYLSSRELPVVQATLITRGGQSDDPVGLTGLASFTASMLDEGAGGRGALDLAAAVERLGATLQTGTSWDAAQVNLAVLRDQFPEALQLMADVAIRPDFLPAELDRVRDERLTALARGRDDSSTIAVNAFASLVYGGDHPYGRITSQESVGKIDRQALLDFHGRFYRPGVSTLVLVGDIDPSVHPLVENAFGGWAAGDVPASAVSDPRTMESTRIFLVDKPGAAQSEIRIGHPGVARDTPDYYALEVLNTLLGGSFTSRLNQNLRETHGYTYGAGSGFSMRLGAGPFAAGAAVVTEKTDSAVIEFFRELNRVRDEAVSEEELQRAKQGLALGLPQQLETTGQIGARISELVLYGLPLDYYDDYVRQIMAVTVDDVQRVARQYLRPDRATVVIVGDREVVESGLRALPVGPVEVRAVEEFVR